MVQFPRYCFTCLCIQHAMTETCPVGLLHSVTSGSIDVCSYPKLFAAYHDLHRHIVPRHPLYTLICLIVDCITKSICSYTAMFLAYSALVLFCCLMSFSSWYSTQKFTNHLHKHHKHKDFSLHAVHSMKVNLFE